VIVDAHHHLWPDPAEYTWLSDASLAPLRRPFTPADLVAELDAASVDRTVLVEGGREDYAEVPQLLALAAATPRIAGVVAWADVTDPDLEGTLAGYRTLPGGELLVGVRSQVQGFADPDYLDRPEVRRGLATVAAAGLAFDLVVRADQIASAARAARAVPELRFVLDHVGKPRIAAGGEGLAQWRGPITELAAAPNVTCKLSGMVTEADWARWTVEDLRPFVETAVAAFGPARVMFGSDWPVALLASTYGGVLDALRAALPPLSRAELGDVFAGTAIRTYGLRD
jgi:L-fuconolactonase